MAISSENRIPAPALTYESLERDRQNQHLMTLLLAEAMARIRPEYDSQIRYSLEGGLYFEVSQDGELIPPDPTFLDALTKQVQLLIQENLPVQHQEMALEEARNFFLGRNRQDVVDLLSRRESPLVTVYRLGQVTELFDTQLPERTGSLCSVHLQPLNEGYFIKAVGEDGKTNSPSQDKPQEGGTLQAPNICLPLKLAQVYQKTEEWTQKKGIRTTADLNHQIQAGQLRDLCLSSEKRQAESLTQLAQEISDSHKQIILVAAPSSSGKTSFAKRLKNALRKEEKRPITISLDDYFLNREETPLDEEGNLDFESLRVVDLRQFNQDLTQLVAGQPVEAIQFDFLTGQRVWTGEKLRLEPGSPVIVEGIHGLNPELTESLRSDQLYRIYLSALPQISLHHHCRIPTSDLRLLRRLARDAQFRGRQAQETLQEWPRVRKGEMRNIFPYQRQADAVFNTSFCYEIPLLKPLVEPLLKKVLPESEEYKEAQRILTLLQYFVSVSESEWIQPNSILREFIGGQQWNED